MAAPAVRAISATFGNTLQIGIPVVAGVFGETGLGLLLTLISVHALVLLLVCTTLVELDLAREQLLALLARHGDHGLLIARKHLAWTCSGFPGAPPLRQALMQAPTPSEALALLERARQTLAPPGDQGSTAGQP